MSIARSSLTAAARAALNTSTSAMPAVAATASRSLTSSAPLEKGPVEATKSTLKKADRAVSDAAVKGIEVGQKATHKIKESVGYGTDEAKGKADELKGQASEMASQVKGKANEVAGEARGKTKS